MKIEEMVSNFCKKYSLDTRKLKGQYTPNWPQKMVRVGTKTAKQRWEESRFIGGKGRSDYKLIFGRGEGEWSEIATKKAGE